jgi:8-oxo-dGTP pyrophosphatase MutT (NUDIX family)
MEHFLSRLKSEMNAPLPGLEAQKLMAPHVGRQYYEVDAEATKAAVLLLLYPNESSIYFTLMKRKDNIKEDKHAGQISLPGGKMDPEDLDLAHTALRETEEELGVNSRSIHLIGQLTKLYVYASNHIVYPYIGVTEEKPIFIPDQREVESLIEVESSYFLSTEIVKTTEIQIRGLTLKDVPYFDIDGEVVWGATAMMLSEFREIWRKVSHKR